MPVKGVRKMTAQAMVASAFSAPHVTEFVTVDVTATTELVPRLRALPEFAGVKVTPLLLVAKALLTAVKRNPEVNATFLSSASGDEIVVKDYVHLGIAAATPRGLLVPNVKDADRLSLVDLARALQDLVATAREVTRSRRVASYDVVVVSGDRTVAWAQATAFRTDGWHLGEDAWPDDWRATH